MSHPMDDLLAELEASERSAPEPPVETADRIWSAIENRLTDGPPPPPVDDAPLFPPASSGLGLTVLKIAGGLAVLGAIGLGVGSMLPRGPGPTSEPAPTPTPAIAASEPAPAPAPEPAPPPEPPPEEPPAIEPLPEPTPEPEPKMDVEPIPVAPKPRPASHPAPASAEPKTLADELALMQSITASLKSNDAGKTLRLVREHERDFPQGQFIEERRAAKARGLCRKGKSSAGRKEAARFEKRWPKSIHLSAVREDCDLD